MILTQKEIDAFAVYLAEEEKSMATIEKYLRDVRAFAVFMAGHPLSKEWTMLYKKQLVDCGYAARSVNSMLASLNSLFAFLNRCDCRVKQLRTQRKTFCPEEKDLAKEEYLRLLRVAQPRLRLIMETICSTGICISELRYFTVEAVQAGEIVVSCKSKTRNIFIPGKLKQKLLAFAKETGTETGVIFRTKNGKPIHQSTVWAEMKQVCEAAGVKASKVFPHNLRKLFAKTFYRQEKDIVKLADLLGHSSVNTTRIYIMSTGTEHRRKIERLGLIV